MGRGPQQMRTIARRLDRAAIPEGVREAGIETAKASQNIGRKFAGRRIGSAVKMQGRHKVKVSGKPWGYWSILTDGHGVSKAKRGSALATPYGPKARTGPAGPVARKSWKKVREAAEDIAPDAIAEQIDRTIGKVL